MTPKEITIVLGLPDNNSGAAALAISLIKTWQAVYPHCKINYVSYHASPQKVEKAHPFVRQACPDVEILDFPLPCAHDLEHIKNPLLRRLRLALLQLRIILSLVCLLFPSLALGKNACRAIWRSDLVIARGTNIFFDKPGRPWMRLFGYYSLCFPFLYARRVRTPYVIYGHSIGPLHDRFRKQLIGSVLRKALLVLPREELSRDYVLGELGVAKDRVHVVPDSVFAWTDSEAPIFAADSDAQRGLTEGSYMCIAIRRGMSDEDSHIEPIAAAIRKILLDGLVERCIILTHCHPFDGYVGAEDDREISERLFRAIDLEGRALLVGRSLSPDSLVHIYRRAKFVIGMRLHAVILSVVAGTPAIALSYWGSKTLGVMRMAGLDHLVFDFKTLTEETLTRAILKLVANIDHERALVADVRTRLQREAARTPLIVVDAWRKRGL